MKTSLSRCSLVSVLLLFVYSLSEAQNAKPSRGWLTVDTIMRDPGWMGTSPNNVFWWENGEQIYFQWRRDHDEGDSLYVASASGGIPRRVTIDERKKLPSRFGNYTKDWSKKVYVRDGDVYVLEIRRNSEMQLTQTIAPESNPRFTFDERKITFERDGNLFLRSLAAGTEIQLTNLQRGSKPLDDRKTDLQKTLERQQLELFEILKERKKDREAQKKLEEMLETKKPKPYYVGQKSLSGFTLSPDERYVTMILSESASSAKRTIVPNYVTESGFTEDINARTKVGEPETTFEFFVYNIALDSMTQVKPDSIPGVIDQKSAADTSKARPKPRPVSLNGPYWSHDGKNAFMQVFSRDNKDRWIIMLQAEKARFGSVVDRQHDDAWIGGPGISGFGFSASVGWMPDNKRIYFQSESDGWSHLYTATTDGKTKTQLTKG